MDKEEKDASIRYGTYASSNKEAEFINAELSKQVQAGNVAVFPLGRSMPSMTCGSLRLRPFHRWEGVRALF